MSALSILAIIALAIVGLLLIAELAAITTLLLRLVKLTQQMQDRIAPVVGETTQLLHKANEIADTVNTDTRKIADNVAGVTEQVASVAGSVTRRVDRTAESMRSVTNKAVEQLTSPPMLSAIAFFTALQLGATIRRVFRWPVVAIVTLLAGIPVGLQAWRSLGRGVETTDERARQRGPLLLYPQEETVSIEQTKAA